VSERHPAPRKSNGAGRGAARGYSWPPFEPGNRASLKHGLFALIEDEEEIVQIAAVVRSSLPLYAPHFEIGVELLAGRLWRLRRAYRYVSATPEGERSRAFEEALNALENVVSRTIARLGLDPLAAAELGVSVQRLAAGSQEGAPFDWAALDVGERRELERLIQKGRRADGD
jgi:hypothetical protein